jgi:hypothetical protein
LLSWASDDISLAHEVDDWQPACQVLSTASLVKISGSSQELNTAPPESTEDEDRTTVMVRNLPSTLTQMELVEELIARGYRGLFDFVYMPMNFRSDGNGSNFHYAFVNFTSTAVAVQLMNQLKSFELDEQEWRSVWSTCQGLDANIERYRNSPLMHELVPADCKPALYGAHAFRVQFPAPTRHIPKPKIHCKSKACEKASESDDIASKSAEGASSKHDLKVSCRPGKSKKNNHRWRK